MNKILLALNSRTFWSVTLLVAYTDLVLIQHVIAAPAWLNVAVEAIGWILVTYFHVNPSQNYTAVPPQA